MVFVSRTKKEEDSCNEGSEAPQGPQQARKRDYLRNPPSAGPVCQKVINQISRQDRPMNKTSP